MKEKLLLSITIISAWFRNCHAWHSND